MPKVVGPSMGACLQRRCTPLKMLSSILLRSTVGCWKGMAESPQRSCCNWCY